VDHLERRLEEARAFARAYCARRGDQGAADRLILRKGDGRVVFSVVDAESCGSSISGFLNPDRQERTLARCLSRVMRQRARDRAIAASGETGSPAWSLDVHVAALSALWHAGINPLLLATHDPRGRPGDSGFDQAVAASPVSVRVEIRAGRVCLPALSVRPDADMDDCIAIFDEAGAGDAPSLMVRGRTLPDTVALSLAGRRLGEAVDHPLLDLAREVGIRRVDPGSDHLVVTLADDRTTLAPPPPGIAPDWLRFDWNP
jgi:hypothetical protein